MLTKQLKSSWLPACSSKLPIATMMPLVALPSAYGPSTTKAEARKSVAPVSKLGNKWILGMVWVRRYLGRLLFKSSPRRAVYCQDGSESCCFLQILWFHGSTNIVFEGTKNLRTKPSLIPNHIIWLWPRLYCLLIKKCLLISQGKVQGGGPNTRIPVSKHTRDKTLGRQDWKAEFLWIHI